MLSVVNLWVARSLPPLTPTSRSSSAQVEGMEVETGEGEGKDEGWGDRRWKQHEAKTWGEKDVRIQGKSGMEEES